MKIMLIGTIESVKKIESIIKTEELELENVIIEDTDLMTKTISAIPSDIDGIFASGIGVYNQLINSYKVNVPIEYAKRGSISFSKCVISNLNEIRKYKRPSFDSLDPDILESLIEEFDLSFDSHKILSYDANYGENSYLLNHIDLYKKKVTDCIFTAYGYSYNILKSMKIPCFRLEATKIDIMDDFENLLSKIKVKSTKRQTFLIHNFHMNTDNLKIKDLIKNYARTFEGLLIDQNNESIVISNRGLSIGEIEENLKILNRDRKIDIKLTLATGLTIKDGIDNSTYARKFLDDKHSIVFYDGKNLKYIDEEKRTLNVNLSENKLEEISKNCGVSLEYIQKIILYTSNKKVSTLTSSQLSDFLKITRRTSNRIINKLVDKGYAKPIYIHNGSKGRPSKSIKILF